MKKIIFIIFILIINTVHAEKIKKYELKGKEFYFNGFKVKTNKKIIISSPIKESDTHIDITSNDFWSILQLDEGEKAEFWLYSKRYKQPPIKLNVNPGNHIEVAWQNDSIFSITWSGMGYSISNYINVLTPTQIFAVNNVLLFDSAHNIYISFYTDGIEVGKVFSPSSNTEKFAIELEYDSVVDAIFSIDKIIIEAESVIVTHRKLNNKVIIEKFYPKLLKNLSSKQSD